MADDDDFLAGIAPVTAETEPPEWYTPEMKEEWRKDRDFLLGDKW